MQEKTKKSDDKPIVGPPVRALHPIRETEVILGLSRASIYRLMDRGLLDGRRVLGRRLVTRASIDALVASAPSTTGARPVAG